MEAIKENRVYTITDADVESFVREGYDIYDNGKLVAYGVGKSVPYGKYMNLLNAYEALQTEYAELQSKMVKMTKKTTTKKTAEKTAEKE